MKFRIVLILLLICEVVFAQNNQPFYKNTNATPDERAKDILKEMTLNEKVGQILCFMGWEMYDNTGNEVGVSETFKTLQKEQLPGMFWATFRADPWTKKTLANGLSPEEAAVAANALQKYNIENSRLGIPIFFAEEAAHGHMAIGTTVFPTSLGQAATFNTDLMEEMGLAIGKEAHRVHTSLTVLFLIWRVNHAGRGWKKPLAKIRF